jgi:putative transposase
MVQYRRNFQQGGVFFFTVTLKSRQSNYLTEYINLLRASFRECKQRYPFIINAIVVLPEHLHCIWTLPQQDSNYSARWRFIKYRFTRGLISRGVGLTKDKNGLYNLWQRRFWEHTIKDENDLQNHTDYIHINPVKHGYVQKTIDWEYSSFHSYVRKGLIASDWGNEVKLELRSDCE